MYHNRKFTVNLFIYLADLISLIASFILARAFWLGLVKGKEYDWTTANSFNSLMAALFSFMIVVFFLNVNHDFFKRGKFAEALYSFKINVIFALVNTAVLFITDNMNEISRGVYLFTVVFNFLLMSLFHIVLKKILWKVIRGGNTSRLFVVTLSDRVYDVIEELKKSKDFLAEICGIAIIDDPGAKGSLVDGIEVTADFNDMIEFVKNESVDEVFIDVPYNSGRDTHKYVEQFERMGVAVHLNIEVLQNFKDYNVKVTTLGNTPVLTFANNFYDTSKLIIKRLFDIIGALVGIIITLVLSIFIAPAILIESPGPLIFKQKRVGRNGRIFNIYKFRSMYRDAEERKKALEEQNEMKGLMFKMTNDPRITKVGKFIRKTSLDELPQFFNVLFGHMSLVGTRPPTVEEFNQYETYHKRRLSFKPGITGMWQVSGRSEIEDFEEIVRLDLKYIDNWSLGLDIRIIFKTVGVLLIRKGAK